VRAIVIGASGQLGLELIKWAPRDVEVVGFSHAQCDITVPSTVEAAVADFRPEVVINAAAYTAVDAAEKQSELAHAVNAVGAGNVARAAEKNRARTIHVSTDYVFDGAARAPYTPDMPANPINEYGRSKAAGEQQVLRTSSSSLIIRSGWLYASHSKNFVGTMLSAMRAGRPLRVVSDQIGVPTSASGLATAIWKCAAGELRGIQHWADEGTASWYDFAVAIQEIALERQLLRSATEIVPVSSDQYPTPARRPRYSVLDARGLWLAVGPPRHWRTALSAVMTEGHMSC
jgi:dTDP-4-dehydrorhamnose reductase